jgi:uncharacterized protein with PIN domain
MNPPDVRFAADAMLQSLAKWIRLLGYDLRRRRRFIRAKSRASEKSRTTRG